MGGPSKNNPQRSWSYHTLFTSSNAEIYERTYIGDQNTEINNEAFDVCKLEENIDIPVSFAQDPIKTENINAQYMDEEGNRKNTKYALALNAANNGKYVDQFSGLFEQQVSGFDFPVGGRNLAAFSVANAIYMTPMLIDFDGNTFEENYEITPLFANSPYQWIAMASTIDLATNEVTAHNPTVSASSSLFSIRPRRAKGR